MRARKRPGSGWYGLGRRDIMFPFAAQNATKAFRLTVLGHPVSRTATATATATATTTAKRPITSQVEIRRTNLLELHPSHHKSLLTATAAIGGDGKDRGRRWSHSTKFRPVQVLDEYVHVPPI